MIDESYEGIVEAKAKFESAFDAYSDVAVDVNEEIYQTVDVMCSVRMTTVVSQIVDFFRSLFN
jgi:hypothetical protein